MNILSKLKVAVVAAMFAATPSMAQITLDGKINEAEISAGNYQLIGSFGNGTTTGQNTGFGPWGMVRLYSGVVGTKLHISIVGSLEKNGNSFLLFLNTPGTTGIAKGTALPSGAAGTPFEKNNAIMDMEVDYAMAFKGGATSTSIFAIDYTTTTPKNDTLGSVTNDGAVSTSLTTNPKYLGARAAFLNTDSLPKNSGIDGLEVELDMLALGIKAGDTIRLFAAMGNNDGGYYSANSIPEIPGLAGANLATNPNFSTLAGNQSITYVLGGGVVSAKNLSSNNFKASVFPNPAAETVNISYELAKTDLVTIKVYDIVGKEVATLVNNRQDAGAKMIQWNNLAGPGNYLVKIQAGDIISTQKVVIVE